MWLQSVSCLCHNWWLELCNCLSILWRTEHVSASGNSGHRPPRDAEESLQQEGHKCESAPRQKSQCGGVAFSPLPILPGVFEQCIIRRAGGVITTGLKKYIYIWNWIQTIDGKAWKQIKYSPCLWMVSKQICGIFKPHFSVNYFSIQEETSTDVGWTFIRMTLYHIHTKTHPEFKSAATVCTTTFFLPFFLFSLRTKQHWSV